MRIDVWSDVVCPWCYIGFVRLEKALAQTGVEAEVFHHAYQLDPTASSDGRRSAEHLAEKYGIGVEDALVMMERVTTIAAADGLKYQLSETPQGNTATAHRLLAYAATVGKQHELLLALFNAYFEQAQPVFSAEQLRGYALKVGLDTAAVDEVLASDLYSDVVAYDKQLAEQIGVRGVPFFVFNQKIAVPGAESVETLVQAMVKAGE